MKNPSSSTTSLMTMYLNAKSTSRTRAGRSLIMRLCMDPCRILMACYKIATHSERKLSARNFLIALAVNNEHKLSLCDILRVLLRGQCIAAVSGKSRLCPICSFFNLWLKDRPKKKMFVCPLPTDPKYREITVNFFFFFDPQFCIFKQKC